MLEVYFMMHDPTSLDRKGTDMALGTIEEAQRRITEAFISELNLLGRLEFEGINVKGPLS